jgi:hypothetical protein
MEEIKIYDITESSVIEKLEKRIDTVEKAIAVLMGLIKNITIDYGNLDSEVEAIRDAIDGELDDYDEN